MSVPGLRSRYRGCLLGGALGDALGAPIEFLSRADARKRFGAEGLRTLAAWDGHPAGAYTDDTQMAIATAQACLVAQRRWRAHGVGDVAEAAHEQYLLWLRTQDDPRQRRGPGTTCLTALRSGRAGSVFEPINDSKGSGGVMRAAPVGLAFQPEAAFEAGAETAAVTHGHPSGYLAAGFIADLVARLLGGASPHASVAGAREVLIGWDDFDEVLEAVDRAVEMPEDVPSPDALDALGRGWVAEEALGMALLCLLRYAEEGWEEGVLAAIDTDGDSDTVGCVAGGLLGAFLGEEALPSQWLARLEDAERIRALADEIHAAFALAPPDDR